MTYYIFCNYARTLAHTRCLCPYKKKQRRQYLNINCKLSRKEGRSRYSHVGTETNGQKSKDKDDVHLSTFYYFFLFLWYQSPSLTVEY